MALGHPPRRRKIAIVDDNVDYAESLALVLRLFGIQSVMFTNGPQFLERFEQLGVDLVILDLRMPGMEGTEVLRKLREEFASPVPVIVLTGHGDSSASALAPHHVLRVLDKSVEPEFLVGLITDAIASYRGASD
jgi:CheY-like chemotaxis protein